jgi:hypothetical protein
MTAARLTAPASAQVVGLSENNVWAVVVVLAWLGYWSYASFRIALGLWGRRGHVAIVADAADMYGRLFLLSVRCLSGGRDGLIGMLRQPLLRMLHLWQLRISSLPGGEEFVVGCGGFGCVARLLSK